MLRERLAEVTDRCAGRLTSVATLDWIVRNTRSIEETRRDGAETVMRRVREAEAGGGRARPSFGRTRRQGSITKSGWLHARRLLVEAAWDYHGWVRLDSESGKRRTLCAVAVARELTGFCWAVSTAG